MQSKNHPSKLPAKTKSGFALISVISLVVLLALVAVALLTLSNVTMRTSSLDNNEAKENAKLALAEALGDLQKAMGPDQRVSAYADALDTSLLAGVTENYYLGVWNSWNGVNGTYNSAKTNESTDGDITVDDGEFIQWLSSGSAANTFGTPAGGITNPIPIVNDGTVTDTNNYVNAELVNIDTDGDGTNDGGYAWHVFDESQKANITLNDPTGTTDMERTMALNNSAKPGFSYVDDFNALDAANLDNALSLDTTELAANGFSVDDSNAFLSLSTVSKGLLVDVTTGKFQTDLSLLFDPDALPAAYSGNHIYSNGGTPIATAPLRFSSATSTGGTAAFNIDHVQPLPNPDPTWDLLHSHYRLYRDIQTGGGSYSIPVGNSVTNTAIGDGTTGLTATPIFDYPAPDDDDDGSAPTFDLLDNPIKLQNPNFDNNQQILPVLSNAQFIYSLASMKTTTTDPAKDAYDKSQVLFITDTVVTFWNPYNVSISIPNMELEFFRFPAKFSFYQNGVALNSGEHFHVSNMHIKSNIVGAGSVKDEDGNKIVEDWNLRNATPYRVRVSDINLSPGEYKVFGATNFNENIAHNSIPISNHAATNLTHGSVLNEGFDETAGGSFTTALMRRDDNTAGAPWFLTLDTDPTNPTISVGASAGIVDPAFGYGGFKDFMGEEPAAYINMYIGDGGDITGTTNTETDFTRILSSLYQDGNRAPIGSIALTPANLSIVMPDIDVSETPDLTVREEDGYQEAYAGKVPMVIASLRLKTETGTNNLVDASNSRMWLNNGITNTFAVNGLNGDQDQFPDNAQYELTWEPMTDWASIPTVEHIAGRGFGGTGVTSLDGVGHQVVASQIPLAPYSSIAQFSHAPLNKSGIAPLTTQIVGNSFAPTIVPQASKSAPYVALGTDYLDHSYLANSTLFDGYFLSTAVDETNVPLANGGRSLGAVLTDFFSGAQSLPNANLEPAVSDDPNLDNGDYDELAAYVFNKGAFNVNSTSVEAWALMLAASQQENLPLYNILTGSTNVTNSSGGEDDLVAFSRFSPMAGNNAGAAGTANSPSRWAGVSRRLDNDEINELAQNIVNEVRDRGPFQSLGEFVNRRLSTATTGDSGAIQSAIDNTNLNNGVPSSIPTSVGTGATSDGAPDYLTQADVLNKLAPSLTVRGDTFTIRAYGDTRDGATIKSKAWCEAIVQRTHEYVDDANPSTDAFTALNTTNQALGRKFKIISFRWLDEDEL